MPPSALYFEKANELQSHIRCRWYHRRFLGLTLIDPCGISLNARGMDTCEVFFVSWGGPIFHASARNFSQVKFLKDVVEVGSDAAAPSAIPIYFPISPIVYEALYVLPHI